MLFIEGRCILTDDQKRLMDFISKDKDSEFPFYYYRVLDNARAFVHCLMQRNSENEKETGVIVSEYYQFFYEIFSNFCKSQGVVIQTVLRGAVNHSIYIPGITCGLHVDHLFPHYNFLLYLSDCKGGDTLVYDDNGQVIKRIPPEKYKAVIFPGKPHAIDEFEPGESRLVLVFTFIGNVPN